MIAVDIHGAKPCLSELVNAVGPNGETDPASRQRNPTPLADSVHATDPVHRDPAGRLLISISTGHQFTLLTPDPGIRQHFNLAPGNEHAKP